MADYNGLTRNQWPGTWSPSSDHPIVLDTEIRGGLRYVSGDSGDRLSDITGQRLQDGMVVYVENGYTEGSVTYQSGQYYKYNVLSGESRDSSTGVLPNDSDNWEFFKPDLTGFVYDSSSGLITITTSDGSTFTDSINLNPFSTTDLSEGTNLYYTTVRVDSDIDAAFVAKSTDNLSEGSTNLYYTSARADSDAKNAISVTDNGGDGSLSYTPATGVISYTGPSASEVRAHFSGGTGVTITDGEVAIGQSVGTTDDVTFGAVTGDSFSVGEIAFQTDFHDSHIPFEEGALWYDPYHKNLNYYTDFDHPIEIGLQIVERVYNNTGAQIDKGKPLYYSGNRTDESGQESPTVALANATSASKYNVQGLAAENIPDGAYGQIVVAGVIDGFDTSGLNAGENFFAGLTDGAVQNAPPTYPNYPMCLGWVIKSDANDGKVIINQQNHSVSSFRVQTDQHVGGDLIIDGDLTVTGTQTITSTANVEIGGNIQYLNAGDTIGEAGTTFVGTGLDDAFYAGHYSGDSSTKSFYVKIDATGTPDTFEWGFDSSIGTEATGIAITGEAQMLDSDYGIKIDFGATTGHTVGDKWTGTATSTNIDTGFFTNRNTGDAGDGYTHVGLFFDVSENKWTFLNDYEPEPEAPINLAAAGLEYGVVKAATFEGNLTGAVTGNAATATSATNVVSTANNSTDETVFLTFVDGQTGAQGIETDNGLTYNPSTGLITTTSVTASGAVNADSATLTKLTVSGVNAKGIFGSFAETNFPDPNDRPLILVDSNATMLIHRIHPVHDASVELKVSDSPGADLDVYWDFFAKKADKSFVFRDRLANPVHERLIITHSDSNAQVKLGDSSDLFIPDKGKILLGDDNDLQIYHDGAASFIADEGTGQLRVLTNQFRVKNSTDNETLINALQNGTVELYYDNTKRFETTDSGVLVTGQLVADSATFTNVTGTLQTAAQANITSVGNLTALRVDGEIDARGGITDNAGNLELQASDGNHITLSNHAGNILIRAKHGGSADLRYQGNIKLETTAYGATVTGTINADSATFLGGVTLSESSEANFVLADKGDGRVDFGFDDTTYGPAFEMYNKQASGSYVSRRGRIGLTYGGGDGLGDISFVHRNSSSWVEKANLDAYGNFQIDGQLDADSATFTGNIRADGGNLILGQEAYTASGNFLGVKTSNMSGSQDYMIISGTSDGNTYVGAKNGNSVFIRGGGNASDHQLSVSSSQARASGDFAFDSSGGILFDKSNQALWFGDNYEAKFGSSGDFDILFNGTNQIFRSNVADNSISFQPGSTGNFNIYGGGQFQLKAEADAEVSLWYNGTKRIETTDTGATVTGTINADSATINGNVELISTDTGATGAPVLSLYRNSASPADNDNIGEIVFKGRNDADQDVDYAKITTQIADASDGTEDTRLKFQIPSGGSIVTPLEVKFDRVYMNGHVYIENGNHIRFEGTTADSFETIFTPGDPTADRTITLPDATGTILLSDGDGSSLTNVDAETLDGIDGASFLRSDAADTKTSGDLTFNDDVSAFFGTGSDLKIHHQSSSGNSFIQETGSGSLKITASQTHILNAANNAYLAKFLQGGAVELNYDGTTKVKTDSDGMRVAGIINQPSGIILEDPSNTAYGGHISFYDGTSYEHFTNGDIVIGGRNNTTRLKNIVLDRDTDTVRFPGDVQFDSAGGILFDVSDQALEFGDNYKATFGASNDLQIYHSGSHSFVRDQGTGHLYVTTNGDFIHLGNGSTLTAGKFSPAGSVELSYNGNKKFETTTTGATITGEVVADSATINGGSIYFDSSGNSDRLQLTHTFRQNGDVLQIQTSSGYIYIGPQNTTWAHFETDRDKFFFNQKVQLGDGQLSSYNTDLKLQRNDNTTHQIVISDSDVQFHNGVLRIDQDTAPSITANKLYNVGGTLFWNGTDVTSGGGGGGGTDSATVSAIITADVDNAFVDALNVNAATVTATANNSTDETVYLTFVDGATGEQGIETDTGLTYNPSSGLITLGDANTAGITEAHFYQTRDGDHNAKFRYWNSSSTYVSGMRGGYTFGGLNGYAINWTMSDTTARGFIWDDNGHTQAQGAMAVTTDGKLTVAHSIRVGYGEDDTTTPGATHALDVNGSFAATTKSFVIDHPTKEGMKLRYGSLEGPENGVYVRGRLKGNNTIELPDYWTGLVDEDTITVNLTAIGKHQEIYVEDIGDNKVIIGGEDINCFYTVYGERKDVDQLVVEY